MAQMVAPIGRTAQVDNQHQPAALPRKRRVDVALDPVVGCAETVLLERFQILRFLAIELRAFPEHLVDAARLRAVRVFVGFDLGVVLAVDRDPFLGQHPGREPEPEAEEMTDRGVKVEAAVRLRSVQIDRDRRNGHVRQHQRDDDVAPPRQRRQTVGEKREKVKTHRMGILAVGDVGRQPCSEMRE